MRVNLDRLESDAANTDHGRGSLLFHGLDFVNSAVERLRDHDIGGDTRELKYSLVHLATGVELILKERLRRAHWSLLFDNPDQANRDKLERGDFSSVRFLSLITRLAEIGQVEFGQEATDSLKWLRKNRNRLEHFGIVPPEAALKVETAKVCSFLLNFIATEIGEDSLDQDSHNLYDSIRLTLPKVEQFVKTRSAQLLNDEIARIKVATVCIECGQLAQVHTEKPGVMECLFCGFDVAIVDFTPQCPCCESSLVLGGGDVLCSSCDWAEEPTQAAKGFNRNQDWIDHRAIGRGEEPEPLWECPDCEVLALVETGQAGGHMAPSVDHVCLACGGKWVSGTLTICGGCGSPYEVTIAQRGCVQCGF